MAAPNMEAQPLKIHVEKKNLFQCNDCQKQFTRKTTLDQHIDAIHKENKSLDYGNSGFCVSNFWKVQKF